LNDEGPENLPAPFNNATTHVESKQIQIAATDDAHIVLKSISHWPDGFTSTVGGGDTFLRQGIYVHPLPPPGPVVVAVKWPARNVDETRFELDGAEIRAGAEKSLPVWS
jgi:hypothetical protein